MSVLQFKRREKEVIDDSSGLRFYSEHKKKTTLGNFEASYLESGSGVPLVFLNGNLYSSFSWRKVVSKLSSRFHCVALNQLGIGGSRVKNSTDPTDYGFQNQRAFLEGFLDKLFPNQSVVLVAQGTGTILGCDWAYRNSKRVSGIVHIRGIFMNALSFGIARDFFEQTDHASAQLAKKPSLIRPFFELWTMHRFSAAEMEEYKRPYLDHVSRATCNHLGMMLAEVGEQAVFAQIVCNTTWLSGASVPKLMIDPAEIYMDIEGTNRIARSFVNQTIVDFEGNFFIQEEAPERLAEEIQRWVQCSRAQGISS